MPHSVEKLIEDALTACGELRTFTYGKTYGDVIKDRGLQLILERLFEVLGETLSRLRKLDEETFERIPEGHRIIGTRNLLAHGYDIVDHEILWAAVQTCLTPLEQELQSISKQ